MKKLLSLVIALALVLCAVPALAETAVPTYSFDWNTLVLYYETFYGASAGQEGATVTWTQGEGTITASAPGTNDVVFHLDANGAVTKITSTVVSGMVDLNSHATALGTSCSLVGMAALMAETNNVETLQTYAATVEQDYTGVFSAMLNATGMTAEQLTTGASSEGTLFGYPAQSFFRVDMSTLTYYIEYTMLPVGGTF